MTEKPDFDGDRPFPMIYQDVQDPSVFTLGLAHFEALKHARLRLTGMSEKGLRDVTDDLLAIFEGWKETDGKVIDPSPTGQKARLIRENATEEERQEFIAGRAPWDCAEHISSPVILLGRLWEIQYQPLMDYLENDAEYYADALAVCILLTDKPSTALQSGDCIVGGLLLAGIQMKKYYALAHEAKLERNRRLTRLRQKSEAESQAKSAKILRIYSENPNLKLKEIADLSGSSIPSVSRYLKAAGIHRYKKDSHD